MTPDAKKKGTPHRWQPGCPSPNPKGRPKEGQSWAAVIKECSNLTPEQVLSFIKTDNDLGQAFAKYPKTLQIKYLVVLRAVIDLMFDPQAAMLNAFMDREDGKVADKLEVPDGINIIGFEAMLKKAYGRKHDDSQR